jgi:hypothetical protein
VRPLAWIITTSADGSERSIPLSFVTPGGTNPPTFVVVLHNRMDGTEKETLQNLRVRKNISLGFVTGDLAEQWAPGVAPEAYSVLLEGNVEFVRSMGSGPHGTHFVLISIHSVSGQDPWGESAMVGCIGKSELIDPETKKIFPISAAE